MTKCEGMTKEEAMANRRKREALVKDKRVQQHFVSMNWNAKMVSVFLCLTTTMRLTMSGAA